MVIWREYLCTDEAQKRRNGFVPFKFLQQKQGANRPMKRRAV